MSIIPLLLRIPDVVVVLLAIVNIFYHQPDRQTDPLHGLSLPLPLFNSQDRYSLDCNCRCWAAAATEETPRDYSAAAAAAAAGPRRQWSLRRRRSFVRSAGSGGCFGGTAGDFGGGGDDGDGATVTATPHSLD